MCGLVGCIVLELIYSGAANDPVRTLTFVAWFHTVRLFGGQLMTTLLRATSSPYGSASTSTFSRKTYPGKDSRLSSKRKASRTHRREQGTARRRP